MNKREIKFRVFYKPKNFIYDVKKIDFEGLNNQIREVWFGNHWVRSNKLDDIVLMQYTGLKDKNGVEIYEGDIIGIENPKEWVKNRIPHYVKYIIDGFYLIDANCEDGNYGNRLKSRMESLTHSIKHLGMYFSVIGNIYENKIK